LPAFFAAWSVFWLQESFHADGNPLAPTFQERAKDYFDDLAITNTPWFTFAPLQISHPQPMPPCWFAESFSFRGRLEILDETASEG